MCVCERERESVCVCMRARTFAHTRTVSPHACEHTYHPPWCHHRLQLSSDLAESDRQWCEQYTLQMYTDDETGKYLCRSCSPRELDDLQPAIMNANTFTHAHARTHARIPPPLPHMHTPTQKHTNTCMNAHRNTETHAHTHTHPLTSWANNC